jgi:hypothetical protein
VTVRLETLTVNEVADRIHKGRRWLMDFAREKGLGRMAGRTLLFTHLDLEKVRLAILNEAMDRGGTDRAVPRPGLVYFMQSGDFIKIGYTRSPAARVMKMRTDCPMPIVLLHSEPGTFQQERFLHRQFAAHRTQGEWFRAAPELLEYIERRKPKTEGA